MSSKSPVNEGVPPSDPIQPKPSPLPVEGSAEITDERQRQAMDAHAAVQQAQVSNLF